MAVPSAQSKHQLHFTETGWYLQLISAKMNIGLKEAAQEKNTLPKAPTYHFAAYKKEKEKTQRPPSSICKTLWTFLK